MLKYICFSFFTDFKADLRPGLRSSFIFYFDGGNEDIIIDDNEGECDTIIGHYYITTGSMDQQCR